MRIVVFFDLPIITSQNKRDYRHFRKFLVKSGFMMLQESVYCKLSQNDSMAEAIVENVKKNSPPAGMVQTLRITEKQYSKMEYIVGKNTSNIIDSDERLIIL